MRRGQAAMEFLMTYGWAILVVLAAIGALAYFGVLSPDRFLPSKCVINPPMGCTEFKITGDPDGTGALLPTVTVGVQNNAGVGLSAVFIEFVTTDCTLGNIAMGLQDNGTTYANRTAQNNGRKIAGQNILWSCGNEELSEGDKFQGDFTIIYTKSGETVTHTTTGSIQGKAEQ